MLSKSIHVHSNREQSIFPLRQLRYPTSFLGLLLVGFAIVTLPLIAGLVSNAFAIDRLSELSQQAVYNATLATKSARQLGAASLALERSARFYAVSGDRDMIESYKRTREQFLFELKQLAALPLASDMLAAASTIKTLEAKSYVTLARSMPSTDLQQKMEREFGEISDRAQKLNALADLSVDAEVESLRASAAKSRNHVYWQMLAMVPSALLMIAGFTYLLTRPIRDLGQAIHRLGQGKLARRIRVTGPRDIEKLGDQLDWLRQRLITLEDQKTRFFQHISHELKTPLTALREGSDLLAEEVVGQLNAEQQEIARILRHNSQSLERLIQDLLTYSQSQSALRLKETQSIELASLQMLDLIDDVLDTQKIALVAKSLSVRREYEKTSLVGDIKKLRVVMDNLISNAIKYSPQGGIITVRLVKQVDNAVIEVVDEGPGIREADRERVFDAFFRTNEAIQSGTKGTGLGLAIVRDYVELHRGSVEAVSTQTNNSTDAQIGKSGATGAAGARMRVILPRFLQQNAL
jgi:two-component system, NtrC family, sensor histidine kinase GlrK